MSEYLDSGQSTPERQGSERRRSRNPLKNMMQHLSVESAEDDPYATGSPRRDSLMRRLSRRKSKSRSPSAHSDRSSKSALGQDPALCKTCASLAADIDATFDEADASFAMPVSPDSEEALERREQFLMRLRGLDENRWSATCPLCKLFWDVRVPSEGEGDYYLAAFSSRDMNYLLEPVKMHELGHPARGRDKGYSPAFLGIVPKKTGPRALGWEATPEWFRGSGMLFRTLSSIPPTEVAQARNGIWGREIGQTADLAVANKWLEHCELNHQGRCGRRPVTSEMPGFRLVDCAQNPPRVVEASLKEAYVALSYVWGHDQPPHEPWPAVVQAAATVVQDMGFRYLWVDRLCVAAAKPEIRMAQLSRMDEIFEGAIFAIIAAHGDDANTGLPGVGQDLRPSQPKYTFTNSDVTVVSSLADPRLSIKESTWHTRAWTYEEALLSRRRLIFTGQQMYWECEGMACPETLILPLGLYHDATEQRMADFVRPGLFNAVSFMDGGWEAWKRLPGREEPSTLSMWREADQHIASYAARSLTYEDDSLNAFLGIARRLERTVGRGRMSNVVGIPLWAPPSDGRDGRASRTRDLFALSTCFWHHKDGNAARRRSVMPSWTWAGWGGNVELYSSVVIRHPEGKARDRKFHSHHYVTATQLTRGEGTTAKWAYSPNMSILRPDGSLAYDFAPSTAGPPRLPPIKYKLRVSNPLVLDRVKARPHPSGGAGWLFNDVSVEARLSGMLATEGLRGYVERHGRGEQMTVLWFVEGVMVVLLIVQRVPGAAAGIWERVGKMRMGVEEDVKGLDKLLERLPLRSLGEDIVIE